MHAMKPRKNKCFRHHYLDKRYSFPTNPKTRNLKEHNGDSTTIVYANSHKPFFAYYNLVLMPYF